MAPRPLLLSLRRFGVLAPLSACGLGLLAAQQPAPAVSATHSSDVSVGFRFGTAGFGLDVSKLLAGHVAARAAFTFFKISTSKSESNISYDAKLTLHAFSVLVDLYPGGRGSFHLTGGLVTNPMTITATGLATGGRFTINNRSYRADSVGTLTAQGKFPGVGPYFGIGVGTPANTGRGLQFLFDLGVVIGQPKISLTATNPYNNAQLTADLQAQSSTTEHDIDKYLKVFPVLAFGLAYRF